MLIISAQTSSAFGFAQFNRKDLADDLFDLNIRLYSDVPAVYNARAFSLLGEEKLGEAAELFEQSLAIEEQANIRSVLEGLRVEDKDW